MSETHYVDAVIADDDQMVRGTLKAILQRAHIIGNKGVEYRITGEAENGSQLEHEVLTKKPDIIVTDLRMPILDGFSALMNLRNNGIVIPSVITTGTLEDLNEHLSSGLLVRKSAEYNLSVNSSEYLEMPNQNIYAISKPYNLIEFLRFLEKIRKKH